MSGRILVVEDEEKLRRVVELQLRGAGFEVDTAGTAEDAKDHARRLQESSYKMWMAFGVEPEEIDYTTMAVTYNGYALRPEEEVLKEMLVTLERELKDPDSFGRVGEIWARLGAVKQRLALLSRAEGEGGPDGAPRGDGADARDGQG